MQTFICHIMSRQFQVQHTHTHTRSQLLIVISWLLCLSVCVHFGNFTLSKLKLYQPDLVVVFGIVFVEAMIQNLLVIFMKK